MSRDFGEDAFSFGAAFPRSAGRGLTGAYPYWESAFDAWRCAFGVPESASTDTRADAGDAPALVPVPTALLAAAFVGAAGFMIGFAAGAAFAQARFVDALGDLDG